MGGSNLHALWDSAIINSLDESPEAMATRLKGTARRVGPEVSAAVVAAQESCQIVGTPGYYPERRVGQDYIDKFKPILEERLAIAGARLAIMLNGALK